MDEIIYPFPNIIGVAIDVWEWISNFIPHFIMDVITYSCWELNQSMLVKGAPGSLCGLGSISKPLAGSQIEDILNFHPWYEKHIFQCMDKIFSVIPLKFHQKVSGVHWKLWFLYNVDISNTVKFKSLFTFLNQPPHPDQAINSHVIDYIQGRLVHTLQSEEGL